MRPARVSAAATLDDEYRYELTRTWEAGQGPAVLWVMLNPSTADGEEDDPTIRRCIGFSHREGYHRMTVVNLFALRATRPVELLRHRDPIGPMNGYYVKRALADVRAYPLAIAAWGAHPHGRQSEWIAALARRFGRRLFCLGTTRDGQPRHPLYLPADAPLIPWTPR